MADREGLPAKAVLGLDGDGKVSTPLFLFFPVPYTHLEYARKKSLTSARGAYVLDAGGTDVALDTRQKSTTLRSATEAELLAAAVIGIERDYPDWVMAHFED